MTKKLYEENPYQTACTTVVTGCTEGKGGFWVTLRETVFYPEGGGQPGDTGTIDGIKVLDTREKDGEVFHICEEKVENGRTVTATIDWQRRFDHMQQHSGEHIVSGMICSRFHCDNVGFHLGKDTVVIDFNAEITQQELAEIEAQVNQYLWENHEMEIQYLSGAELEQATYRSKKFIPGMVRITTFSHADCCACCGTHVKRSGEIGLVKLLSCQKIKEGTRIEMVCGKRAYDYLCAITEQNKAISQLLSKKPTETFSGVERLTKEIYALKGRTEQLEQESFAQKATQYQNKGNVLLLEEGLTSESIRKLCDTVAAVCGGRCAIFSKNGDGVLYAVYKANRDLRPLAKLLNEQFHGRGGGKGDFIQGSLSTIDPSIVENLLANF